MSEINRLRGKWTESMVMFARLQNDYDVLAARSKDKDAKIEQLKAEVEQWKRSHEAYRQFYHDALYRVRTLEGMLGEANIAIPEEGEK